VLREQWTRGWGLLEVSAVVKKLVKSENQTASQQDPTAIAQKNNVFQPSIYCMGQSGCLTDSWMSIVSQDEPDACQTGRRTKYIGKEHRSSGHLWPTSGNGQSRRLGQIYRIRSDGGLAVASDLFLGTLSRNH
jgi:hypothetical protein